jgi:hypothetical protein
MNSCSVCVRVCAEVSALAAGARLFAPKRIDGESREVIRAFPAQKSPSSSRVSWPCTR